MVKHQNIIIAIALLLFTCSRVVSQVDENVFREVGSNNNLAGENLADVLDLHLNFNSDWHFHLGETPGFFEPAFNDSGWRVLDVPHDWSVEGKFSDENPTGPPGGYLPTGIGCYRKYFVLPEGTDGKRVKIRFDGVYMNSSVYINGNYLGNRPYGFSTFEYDLTPYLKYNGITNIIAVKVDNSLPFNCRWYTGSGINRNVNLFITEQQHFKSFATFFRTSSIDNNIAQMKVDCEVVSNNYPESDKISFQRFPEDWKKVTKNARIKVLIKDNEGGIFAESNKAFELGDYTSKNFSFELEAKNPVLWSDKNPYLYTMELQLWIEDRLVDSEQQKVGIRTIAFSQDLGMLVNGEKLIAKGVCLHKDAGSFGTAVPKDVWRYRLEKLKKMGCNAIRTHGPVDPVFIDVCDEMGFYLMAEAFDEWNKRWHFGWSEDPAGKKANTYHKFFNQWAETDLKDMVKRDRNHPSVFMYSVGNEVPDQRYADGPKTLKMLMNWAKEEDDTRMITATCDWAPWANASGFLDSMDIAGYNYPDRYFKEHYREEHARYPNRILLGAENYQTLKNWIAVRDNPYVVGLFLWVGIDYLGESLGWPRRGWEWGLIDIGTFEKTLYYYWQAFWSEKPMVHIAVNLKEKEDFEWRCYDVASHWNFEPGDVDTVFVYSNTETVELLQNGRSLGTKKVNPDTYQAIYLVDYKKGELTANAFNGGKKVATHSIKTAGEPDKIVLKNERESVSSDKDRLIFLTLEIQDQKGARCPFADDEVTVEVSGAGELIGLDSGNQFSHELYKQNIRKAYEGRLLLTIRPKGEGTTSVQCRAGNLETGTINIQ
ncbi:MAG TPA: glycoside hydrolase family 2 TIM barrel-domain containing protein [Draconibacterium sp.]|nr:glycoside hydrolase family 2 TIM barrel-domain containing protein [Draconibacterium sp.]